MRNISGDTRKYTVEESIKALKSAGYDRVDISLWALSSRGGIIDSDSWEEEVLKIAECCRDNALPVHQTHGNTAEGMDWDDPEYDWAYMIRTNLRCIKATKMLGGEWMVVHPMNLPRDPLYSRDKAREANIRYLAPYIEEAKRQGIGLAVENMVDFRNFRRRYCGGDIYELIELVDTINDPSVQICLDTGHANLSGIDVAAAIRAIGPRLKATHINDNRDNGNDEHLFPYFGTVNWKETMKAFGEIAYDGDFAYEAGSQKLPADAREFWLKYTSALGRELMALAK